MHEVGVVAAVLALGSEKAAAHRLGLSHSTVKHHLANARSKVGATTTAQLVWILGSRLPEPGTARWFAEDAAVGTAVRVNADERLPRLPAGLPAAHISSPRRRSCQ
jgi:hypothetical protein